MISIIIAIIFVIFIVLDILGHRRYKVGRKAADWIVLCAFIGMAALFCFLGVNSLRESAKTYDTGPYLTYRYLMDGDPEGARSVLVQDESISETQRDFLEMLAFGLEGDYKRMYFGADRFLSDPSGLKEQIPVGEEVYTLAMNAASDGSNQKKRVSECIEESYAASGIRETTQLQEYYELDKQIRSGNTEGIAASRMRALTNSFPEEKGIKKLAVSYFVLVKDFDSALEIALDLMKTDKTPASTIIYTDVFAQRAYQMTEEEIRASEDKEVADLVKKSDAAAQKAQSYEQGSDNEAKQTELSREYLESASNVYYQRVVNYINVKKPFTGDKTGLYPLQLVKMQLLMGEKDTARKGFMEALGNASALAENSPVREPLLQMAADLALYARTGESEYKDAVYTDCYAVFAAESQGVIKTPGQNINSYTAGRLAAMTVYDRDLFAITKIDTSSYPKISAVLNTNLQKDNIFGGSGEFYRDDFRVKDNDETIGDFSMTAQIGTGDRSTVIAVDVSDEATMDELRAALSLVPETGLARRTALVNGDARVVSAFDDSTSRYLTAVRELTAGGSADAFSIMSAGKDQFFEKNYEDSTILLITDDARLDEQSALEIQTVLNENNIRCFVIALLGTDETILRQIAEGSGGFCFIVDRAEEIASAVESAADLMNNTYVFSYRADENAPGGRHTVSISLIKEENSASADYLREAAS